MMDTAREIIARAPSVDMHAHLGRYFDDNGRPEDTLDAMRAGNLSACVATIIGDAKRHGLAFEPVDVQHSDWDCTLENDDDAFDYKVRMGLRYIKGLPVSEANRILEKRPFRSLEDFRMRTGLRSDIRAKLDLLRFIAEGT